MYDESGTVSKFVNPFSQDVIRMSERFDNATINHNFNELEQLLAEAEKCFVMKMLPPKLSYIIQWERCIVILQNLKGFQPKS